jgi:anti-sigma regulatory factor (Ser/Thr protein kinase)
VPAITLSSLDGLPRALDQIREFAAAHGIPAHIQRELHLVFDEIVTNIYRYGYGGGTGEVTMVFEMSGGGLDIEIRDRARAFNPLERPAPDISLPPDQREVGGLGIYFVRQLMDTVEYTRTDRENRLRVTRRITPRA